MSERGDSWGTGWMIVAMVLFGILAVVIPLVWGKQWEGWNAVAALGGWAAAAATFLAVVVALNLGRKDEGWRERAYEAETAKSRVKVLSCRVSLGHLLRELRSHEKNLKAMLDGDFDMSADLLSELYLLLRDIREKADRMQPEVWAYALPTAAERLAVGLEELRHAELLIRFASETVEGRETERQKGCHEAFKRLSLTAQCWGEALTLVNEGFPIFSR